jgi:hypothetical protein
MKMTCTGIFQQWVGQTTSIDIPLSHLPRKIGQPRRIEPDTKRTVPAFRRLLNQLQRHLPIGYDIQVLYGHVLRYCLKRIDSPVDPECECPLVDHIPASTRQRFQHRHLIPIGIIGLDILILFRCPFLAAPASLPPDQTDVGRVDWPAAHASRRLSAASGHSPLRW